MASGFSNPTILLVDGDRQFRDVSCRLQQKGYLILEAYDAVQALGIVVQQARRIHLLLTADSDDARAMAATLKPYRPDMDVVHINSDVELNSILMEVSKVLGAREEGFEGCTGTGEL